MSGHTPFDNIRPEPKPIPENIREQIRSVIAECHEAQASVEIEVQMISMLFRRVADEL